MLVFYVRNIRYFVIFDFFFFFVILDVLKVISERADKRLAGTSAVQTFIYQFVVLNKINANFTRFEQKYLDLRLKLYR